MYRHTGILLYFDRLKPLNLGIIKIFMVHFEFI